ncbi:family 43 glycosylhydrolase [Echinimonas agarilytica]|uniref:Family 43 glycosylhydrolase n=1 Tax=Echinimonas agarilytica TaxID=1215918 RepID=A0AA42B720_9GAMM|nr:family 43 glycosylhydrolase [Echinimonas agarilytica]MCM2679375.1 family 43 glycosylhydrolase [Echinimonas agarilytica]
MYKTIFQAISLGLLASSFCLQAHILADHIKQDQSLSESNLPYGHVDVKAPNLQVPASTKPLFEQWMRDTFVKLGHDGYYYLTGTSKIEGNPNARNDTPGILLWRSKDLKQWEFVGNVFDFNKVDSWQKNYDVKRKRRTMWAPEIHYIKSLKTYFIIACTPYNSETSKRGTYILRSTSGKAEGPYVNIKANETTAMNSRIDGSLFEDEDGTVYLVSLAKHIAKMKPDMSDIAEPYQVIKQTPYDNEPYIEGAYMVKEGGKYHLIHAIWSYKLPDGSYAYDEDYKNKNSVLTQSEQKEARYSYDVVIASADSPYGPFGPRYTSVIGAGHNNLFKDKAGNWWATMFGNPRESGLKKAFVARPAVFQMEYKGERFYAKPD